MAFEELVLKHAPWSISKLGVLELCARQYLYKYMEKLQEAGKHESGRVGVAGHAILEYGLKQPDKPLDPVVDITIANDKLTSDEERAVRGKLPAMEEFVERMEKFKAICRPKKVFVEHKLGLTSGFQAVDFFNKTDNLLRGVVDYALLSHDDVLIIIDHKFGKKKKIEDHGTQLNAYRIMGLAAVPEAKAVQCAINYVGQPKLDWAPNRHGAPGPYTRAEVESFLHPWLVHYLNKQGKKLLSLEGGNAFTETGWQCEYCGFVSHCSAGREKVNERRAKRGETPLDL